MEEEEIPIAIWQSVEFDVLAVILGENMGRPQSRLVNINRAHERQWRLLQVLHFFVPLRLECSQ